MKNFFKVTTILIFAFAALGVGALVLFPMPWNAKKSRAEPQARIIIPQNLNAGFTDTENQAELLAREESMTARVALADGEAIITVLGGNFDGSAVETQFVAYRNLLEIESPIYITYIDYDESARSYKRIWNGATAATRPGTVSVYTQDLLGDRSVCILLFGMNGLGEHTLTIYRKNPKTGESAGQDIFSKIAELRIDGNISVKEIDRTQAYQMGIGLGQSFTISAYGRDFESSNILDQVEIVYAYNRGNGLYEQQSMTRIPGTQIEQRRVRELLGNAGAFEEFITGLWYYTTNQGTIDIHQYIYFDPPNRELIFYGDETQQVFTWQNSAVTRYGLYISSQNISVSTLRRSIDIELESLDSIRIRVFEEVRLKIGVNAPWDGSYRKAGSPQNYASKFPAAGKAFINARYDGPIGKIRFLADGSYELNSAGNMRQGRYSFFNLNDLELLEFRSDGVSGPLRETYLVEAAESPPETDASETPRTPLRQTLSLLRVKIGTGGIERLHEGAILLTLAE